MIFKLFLWLGNDGENSVVSSGKPHRGIDNCTNLFRSMKIFLECPKFLGIHENYLQHFIFEHNKNSPKCQKTFKHWEIFQSAQFFWAEMKKINIYNFPKQAKISKIAQIYLKHLRKKISWIFISEHRICWIPKFLSQNEKKIQPM